MNSVVHWEKRRMFRSKVIFKKYFEGTRIYVLSWCAKRKESYDVFSSHAGSVVEFGVHSTGGEPKK